MGAAPSLLGLWTTPARTDAVSFEAGSSEVPVWRVSLPADVAAAKAQLQEGMARVQTAERELGTAAARIETLAQTQRASASFDVTTPLPPPEAELLKSLKAIQASGQVVNFGLGEDLTRGWQQATQQFQSVIDQLVRFVAYYAWVETEVGGQLLGRTAVNWLGDMDTLWCRAFQPEQIALHERTLALALHSRQTLLRAFTIASKGAVLLATLPALLTTPAGALLALPAAWKFVNQVLAELNR